MTMHPALKAAIDPDLYRSDAEYHAAVHTLGPVLEAVEEALTSSAHLGTREVLLRVAQQVLPTADDVRERRREVDERVRFMRAAAPKLEAT